MFGFGTPELLLLLGVVVFVGLLVLIWVSADPWVTASQTLVVPGLTVAELDGPVFSLLGATRGAELTRTAPGVFLLVVRRSPSWIGILVLFTLPLGLLLLLIKHSEALQVLLTDRDSGAEVRIVGRTTESVVKTLAKALGSLDAKVNVR